MSVSTEKKIFISYARADVATVQGIAERLRDFEHCAFIDDQLRAGDEWWEVILENIRACTVFLFFVSPGSVRSRACRAELGYAHGLRSERCGERHPSAGGARRMVLAQDPGSDESGPRRRQVLDG